MSATPFADYMADPSPGRVFPCVPGGKEPACPGGHRSASADLGQLQRWAAENPRYNVGLDPHSLGLCVVDIDGADGEQAWAALEVEHGVAPDTLTVRTPRGGRHLYFKGELPTTAGKLGPHVDTRGSGSGYVLIPPSVTPTGAYSVLEDREPAELPEWIAGRLAASQRPAQAAPEGVELDSPANVSRARAALSDRAPAIEGQAGDAHTFATAAMLRDLGVSEETALSLMLEDWNGRCEPPWEEGELAVKVANAYAYGQNEPGAWAVPSSGEAFGEAVAQLAASEPEAVTSATIYPRPKSARDLARSTFPRAEYALERFILKGHVNLLYGDGGAGKTLLALNWAVALAAGVPVFGSSVMQMPVVVILAEDDDGETKARLEAICAMLKCDLAALPLTVWCLPGWDATLAHIRDDGTWEPGPFMEPLKAVLRETGPCFLVLDTVSDIAALDETKRLPVNTLCKAVLTGLCREHGATVLVNAHPSKAAMNDGTGYAGSTAWNNAVRNRLSLERPDAVSPRRILKVAKANYGQGTELELFQIGLTFATGRETAASDRATLLRDACVKVACMAAEHGAPIQRQRRLAKWQFDEIEAAVGYRPSDRDVKEEMASAMHAGALRYIRGTNLTTAGYYPPDQARAEALARQARKVSSGEVQCAA